MQLVDYCKGRILRPRAQMKHGDNLGERVEHEREPEHMHAAAEASA
jgi:hypothetical protein